jgi:hypothetical protein
MNPTLIVTAITGAGGFLGLVVTLWTIPAHFDKRNADRFDSLQREIQSSKEVLRAEMREMRAELRLEIREAGDRRVSAK